MERSALKMIRRALVVLLAAALMVPVAVEGVSAVPADDNTPAGAQPLVTNPKPGTLDTSPTAAYGTDGDADYYSIHLDAGQALTARLMGPAGTVFTLRMYAPEAATATTTPVPVAESLDAFYPAFLSNADDGSFGYVAPVSGTYYLSVVTVLGTGAYDLQWAVGTKPTVNFGPSQYIVYGKSATLSGSVLGSSGAALPGTPVELYAWSYLSDDFTFIGATQTTTGGAFSFTVTPSRWTYYKAVALVNQVGHSFGQSVYRQVKVRPTLTAPKTTTYVSKNRAFKIWGYMTPKHASGNHTVYIYAYKKDSAGNYVYKKKIRTTNYNSLTYSTKTKYYTKAAYLPSAGTWKLVAKSAADGKHAYNKSSPIYLRVH